MNTHKEGINMVPTILEKGKFKYPPNNIRKNLNNDNYYCPTKPGRKYNKILAIMKCKKEMEPLISEQLTSKEFWMIPKWKN